ncbi:hypothetical protein SPHI_20640 [Sphingomonas jeddahensis]|uniref:Uncharacterized protein n=1 Tax=Sphingomonas jeddahensis TaxID=1915074 RepID=A0A1V2ET47_9SPHN|nr:hypothetical protein SPHI_20640 [Sphingomonas jeddahensis]
MLTLIGKHVTLSFVEAQEAVVAKCFNFNVNAVLQRCVLRNIRKDPLDTFDNVTKSARLNELDRHYYDGVTIKRLCHA